MIQFAKILKVPRYDHYDSVGSAIFHNTSLKMKDAKNFEEGVAGDGAMT
jgi:hypothetical protein